MLHPYEHDWPELHFLVRKSIAASLFSNSQRLAKAMAFMNRIIKGRFFSADRFVANAVC
jgi:hypothetical protein